MRHLLVAITVGIAALALIAAGRAPAEIGPPPAPSKVVYPTQSLPLSFSHEQHLKLEVLSCDYCHEDAEKSLRASDMNVPPEAVCATCHPIDRAQPTKAVPPGKPDAACVSCHPTWAGPTPAAPAPPRVVIPAPNLKFNHKLHVDRNVACATCHGDLTTVGLATRLQLPRMSLCLTCHDSKTAPSSCTTCHLAEVSGLVKTTFPEGQLLPTGQLRGDAHDPLFRRDHRRAAQADPKYCDSCHQRSYCQGCHDGVVKPMDIHPSDYVNLHTADARRNSPDCQSCHRQQTFCTGCHARTGVTDDPRSSGYVGPPEVPITRRYHPEGWVAREGGRARNDHSFQAQRNMKSCASCHREESCLDCHRTQFNPHPAGFSRSARCASLAARNGRVCLRCHLDANEARCD
jgi:hypothetical protein